MEWLQGAGTKRMASEKLTALRVAKAKTRGLYGDGRGLYLRVGKTPQAKSWVLRYMVDGQTHEMGLGGAADFTLKEARERARKYRQMLVDGVDPLAERRRELAGRRTAAAKGMTFRQCAEAYIKAKSSEWKNARHAAQWPATLEAYVYPVIGALPVQAIDTALVMKALAPIWQEKPETSSRVRGRVENVLDWAATAGYRTGDNPARWRGHLENLLPKVAKAAAAARRGNGRGEHHAALPYAELPAFMASLRQQKGIGALALEFAILTVGRTGEVIGARWDEFNMTERLWTVPGDRMKAGKEHRVALGERALAIIEAMAKIRQGACAFVFPGRRRGGQRLGSTAMIETLHRVRPGGGLTVHGFRSSFADWCAAKTSFASEVREMALAHTVGNKVERAYRRDDLFEKRRQLAEAWSKFCARPSPPAGAEIVPIRA
jgi:integrase